MNDDAEFIARHLKCWLRVRDKLIAALAKKHLSDAERRDWIRAFKSISRLHRKILHTADWYEAVPPAELAAAWREFVETGVAVCDDQADIILARMEKAKPLDRHYCALANSLARVMTLSRDFDGYKREMFADLPPSNSPAQ